MRLSFVMRTEFIIVKQFRFQTNRVMHECDWAITPPDFDIFPDSYRTPFVMMVCHWAKILATTEVSPSLVT